MNWRYIVFGAAFAAACSSAPAPQPVPPPAQTAQSVENAAAQAKEAAEAASKAAEQKARFAYLEQRLEKLRKESHVPGMSVAVVKNGEVVFAKGFGLSNIDAKEPVTPETTFMVGSTTKAFTATVLGMLVDKGQVSWDDPLSKHLPLKLQVEGDREPTVRDALCHRTGFSRMTMLMLGKLSEDEIYGFASKAKATAKVGEKWQYNNVMYMAAGDVSARVAGVAWADLVAERIFKPLGMSSTTARLSEAKAAGALSSGYSWVEHRNEWKPEDPRDIGPASPAGAIVSSAVDMAKWMSFQLAGGAIDGKQLISKAALAEIHKPQMKISESGESSYGLGWAIETWNGKRHLQHGGSIDGFGTGVGFLPDEGIAYVVLTNTSSNLAMGAAGPMALEALLTDIYKGESAEREDFAPYIGDYVADFSSFDGKTFKVMEKNGKLAVDVPGQMAFELKPPDAEGRRYFALTNEVFVTFAMDGDRAVALEMNQGGIKMEIWREGIEPPADVDMAVAGPLLGDYTGDDSKVYSVQVHRGRLAVDVPGQMKFVLHPPKEGKWRLRAKPEYYVVFDKDAMVIHQDDKEIKAKRTGKAKPQAVVTLAKLNKVRRVAQRKRAIAGMGHAVSLATATLSSSGLTAKVTMRWTGFERWREDWDISSVSSISLASTKDSAWVAISFDADEQLQGKEILEQRINHPMALVGDWSALFDSIKVRGSDTVAGKAVAVVELKAGELEAVKAYVDIKTGDVVKATFPSLQGPLVTIEYSDFRRVRGVRIPFQWEFKNPVLGTVVVKRSSIKARQKEAGSIPATLPQ